MFVIVKANYYYVVYYVVKANYYYFQNPCRKSTLVSRLHFFRTVYFIYLVYFVNSKVYTPQEEFGIFGIHFSENRIE